MSKFFINRPIVAMVISILMTIVGLVAMSGLPTAQFPNIVPPQINVSSTYTGADALTVEQAVATPIEQQMSGVDNMDYMYSINANNGQSTLYVNFALGTDANTDQLLAQMREGQAEAQLPSDVRNYGVTVAKSTSSPLIMFGLYSPNGTYDNVFLANYAYININDQMTRVKGIASVTVFGAGQYAMRLWVRPDQLAKLNITIPEIVNAVNAQNAVNPAGTIGAEPVPPGQEFCGVECPKSDRNVKRAFLPVDAADVLRRVVALEITTWEYKKDPADLRHLGPMAQDFKQAFGLGHDDKTIFPLDASGVAMAAIQALHAENEALRERLAQLELRLAKQGR